MVIINGSTLTIEALECVAQFGDEIVLDEQAMARVRSAHARVQKWGIEGVPIYGVNTGFGEFAHMIVPPEQGARLQVNLLRNHAAGAGPAFSEDVTRAVLVARLNCLMRGFSGIGEEAMRLLGEFLNSRVHPIIPAQGSLGASGDISPLCHMALPLIGEGYVLYEGRRCESEDVLRKLELKPVELGFKEGLALINGTSASCGLAALTVAKARRLLELEVLLSAIYVECLRGGSSAFEPTGHRLKGHDGQIRIAEAIERLIAGSPNIRHHGDIMREVAAKSKDARGVVDVETYIQSAYSLRCVPQVLGPVLDTLKFCTTVVETELNSSNDNPLILDTAETTFHGGNFHGQYLAMACDYLCIALVEIGVLAERQVNRLVDPHLNAELTDFLALTDGGLSSGLSGAQYLATSIAAENMTLAFPACITSLPSNGGNQDIVSMSLNSARKAMQVSDNVETILAVLSLCVFQACHVLGRDRFSMSAQRWVGSMEEWVSPYRDEIAVSDLVEGARAHSRSRAAEGVARNVDLLRNDHRAGVTS